MTRRALGLAGVAAAVTVPIVAARAVLGRGGRRILDAPRTLPDEASLAPTIEALGGEVVRLRSRDGLRLSGRWIPAEAGETGDGEDAGETGDTPWQPDPHEAIVLLHGWSGSVAPDIVEYGPFLRRVAGLLALDFRGHGESDDAPTTFGLHEVEDVAGALAWLGERGIRRVALVGTSMGAITAIAAVGILGDGSLASADMDLDAPAGVEPPPRPRIVAVVADSAAPELAVAVGSRLPGPFGRVVANRLFVAAARELGADPRATEPIRMIGLVEPVPLLLIHGEDDDTVPLADGRRLAAAAGPSAEHWVVPGAGHAGAHAADPAGWESRVGAWLRGAFVEARTGSL